MTPYEPDICIVRLSTAFYRRSSGVFCCTRSLRIVKKLCSGFQIFADDVNQVGSEFDLSRITNLNESADGLYRIEMCNQRQDWESGTVYDWDYKLVPYKAAQARKGEG